MEIINLTKQELARGQYTQVINTSFTQLIPTVPTNIAPTISVQEFFGYYSSLFFQIPEFGDVNSHQYIINTSTEYIGETGTDDTTQALIDEITQLREENLELQQQLFDSQQQT
tara:strand:+ start:52 stop:390 length:339 start_codon:yes stop_codon:yes gene_type:complete